MNFADELTAKLAQIEHDPALKEWILAQFNQVQTEAAKIPQMAAEIKFKTIKIEALTRYLSRKLVRF